VRQDATRFATSTTARDNATTRHLRGTCRVAKRDKARQETTRRTFDKEAPSTHPLRAFGALAGSVAVRASTRCVATQGDGVSPDRRDERPPRSYAQVRNSRNLSSESLRTSSQSSRFGRTPSSAMSSRATSSKATRPVGMCNRGIVTSRSGCSNLTCMCGCGRSGVVSGCQCHARSS
jgi:hypothetical protein